MAEPTKNRQLLVMALALGFGMFAGITATKQLRPVTSWWTANLLGPLCAVLVAWLVAGVASFVLKKRDG